MQKSNSSSPSFGFTIVELLVVIVVIGILAAITLVAYNGISQRAITSSLQSDLTNASQQLKLFYVDNSAYPLTNNCTIPQSTTNICLKTSPNNSLTYYPGSLSNPQTFGISAGNSNSTRYNITDNSSAIALSTSCPSGFITVPGSTTYGTSDFCIMKYEAKQSSTTVPISQAIGAPWVNINQTDSAAYSQNVAGCTGCHLITEAEWLTISQNVLSVPSNWSGGAVGSGYIYSGHNDSAPATALVADSNDANGYAGETNTGGNQKRTLTLTNGQVIWDLAGNVHEWTSGQVADNQPGILGGGFAWRNYNALTTMGGILPNLFPNFGNSSAGGWTTTNGLGGVHSSTEDNTLRGFRRGGGYASGVNSGIYMLALLYIPTYTSADLGFRVTR